jgi:adenine-specific DNA-methyltransferase
VSTRQIALEIPRDTLPGIEYGQAKGAVFTKPWVVDLILDFCEYTTEADLGALRAAEPSAGEGAFLMPMVSRLIASARAYDRDFASLGPCLVAYELSELSAQSLVTKLRAHLASLGISHDTATALATEWIRVDDYLLAALHEGLVDRVIGNPPYIRYDHLNEGAVRLYRALYPTMRGRGDIYVGFIEAALKQLKPGGKCAFICADRWMLNAYGADLRNFVSSHFAVDVVLQMHDAPAFENDVSAYPAVVVLRRGPQERTLVAEAGVGLATNTEKLARTVHVLAADATQQVGGLRAGYVTPWFRGPDPWPLTTPERISLLRDLEQRYRPLEDALTGTKVGIGVATGADDVFITMDAELVEGERLLPLAMSEDIRKGHLSWSGHFLVDPWDQDGLVDLSHYPLLKQYLEQNAGKLRRRHIAKGNDRSWYRTIDRVTHRLTHEPKLLFQDMKLRANPVLDRGSAYPHHNLYWITSAGWDLEVLGGLLLSAVAQFFVESYCVKMRGGTLRFQAQYLRRIRVPTPDEISTDIGEELRRAFVERDAHRATAAALAAYQIEVIPASGNGS